MIPALAAREPSVPLLLEDIEVGKGNLVQLKLCVDNPYFLRFFFTIVFDALHCDRTRHIAIPLDDD